MSKKLFLFFLLTFMVFHLISYEIEQISVTFIDPSRNNRQIPTQIFIPVESDSYRQDDQAFPFIVFGHGYLTSYSNYNTVWEAIVPLGWLMVFPTTEGGILANAEQFALDLAFLSYAVPAAGENPASFLYNLIEPTSVVMGHSMGGGCSVLAASYANNFESLVTLAAWRLFDSSPIDAALNVNLPSLTFAGADDDFIPPPDNQLLIYQNLASIYKSYILMNGVNHSQIYVNDHVFTLIGQWLDFALSDEIDSLALFETTLEDFEFLNILSYMIENRYPPVNLTIDFDDGWMIISWDKALGADDYIVEAADNPDSGFSDLSSFQGNFAEDDNRIFWSFQPTTDQNRLFFQVKIIRNLSRKNDNL